MSTWIIPGPYTPADSLISALGHLQTAKLALANTKYGESARPYRVAEARHCITQAETCLREALAQEPTATERARAYSIDLDTLLGRATAP